MKYLDKTGLTYFWNKVKNLVNTKQDKLTAGENITITNNVISAAGTEVDLTEIENNIAAKQDKLIAGENITIVDNVISAAKCDVLNTYNESTTDTYSCDYINDTLGDYTTKEYVDSIIENVEGEIEPPTTRSMTGHALNIALNSDCLNTGDSIICTEDYADDYVTYIKGHTYIVKEKERGVVPIADQLEQLGFTLNTTMKNSLVNNGIKYYYIANKTDSDGEVESYAAYSKVPLITTSSKFPETGWKTFAVRRASTSDPNFYRADPVYGYNPDMTLTGMTILSNSTNDGNWWSPQYSGTTLGTYTNDSSSKEFTYYGFDPNDMIQYLEDATYETLGSYYTKNEIDNTVGDIESLLEVI